MKLRLRCQRKGRKGTISHFQPAEGPTIRVFSVIMRSSRTFVRSSIVHSQDIQRVAWHCLGHANCEEDANWCRLCKNMELTFASFSERIKWGDGNLQYGTDWHWLIATSNCRSLQCYVGQKCYTTLWEKYLALKWSSFNVLMVTLTAM